MALVANKYFLYFLLFYTIHCTSFLHGNRPTIDNNIIHTDKSISYELLGFQKKENKSKATEILKTLIRSNRFKEVSHYIGSDTEWKIQIILEQSPEFAILLNEPTQPVSWMPEKSIKFFSLYIVNRIISMSTRFLFPMITQTDHKVTFKVWKSNLNLAEYPYRVETWRVFGWVSLILFPFDDKKEIKEIYKNYTLKFLKDSEKIYEQSKD
ncbi:MAG: hypothetical protein IPL26_04390 [Leptospiraceae bacterium]|nr:hypothetical protein [Leptospiraceae bacterium]